MNDIILTALETIGASASERKNYIAALERLTGNREADIAASKARLTELGDALSPIQAAARVAADRHRSLEAQREPDPRAVASALAARQSAEAEVEQAQRELEQTHELIRRLEGESDSAATPAVLATHRAVTGAVEQRLAAAESVAAEIRQKAAEIQRQRAAWSESVARLATWRAAQALGDQVGEPPELQPDPGADDSGPVLAAIGERIEALKRLVLELRAQERRMVGELVNADLEKARGRYAKACADLAKAAAQVDVLSGIVAGLGIKAPMGPLLNRLQLPPARPGEGLEWSALAAIESRERAAIDAGYRTAGIVS